MWYLVGYLIGFAVGGYVFYGVGYNNGYAACQVASQKLIDEAAAKVRRAILHGKRPQSAVPCE